MAEAQRGWLATGRLPPLAVTAAGLLAACTPTVEFSTAVPVAPGVTFELSIGSGFRGTVEFRCRQALPVTIIGGEGSIVLVDSGIATTLTGGPYRYTAPGLTVVFEEGYNQLTITDVTGRRACRG